MIVPCAVVPFFNSTVTDSLLNFCKNLTSFMVSPQPSRRVSSIRRARVRCASVRLQSPERLLVTRARGRVLTTTTTRCACLILTTFSALCAVRVVIADVVVMAASIARATSSALTSRTSAPTRAASRGVRAASRGVHAMRLRDIILAHALSRGDGDANADDARSSRASSSGSSASSSSTGATIPADLDRATQAEMEALYPRAKEAYYDGAPLIDDVYFDALEAKLMFLNSDAVKKYPRCSVRGKAVYSDCVTDEAQMRALQTSYAVILAVGAAFIFFDFGDDVRALLSLIFSLPDGPRLRIPIMGLIGIGLASRGVEKLRSVKSGETLAMTGECPACHEQVYSFLSVRGAQGKSRTECHCCARKIVFETQFEKRESSPWKVVGKGRIYLVSERSDYESS
jgi:hypothetical protein